MKGKKVKFLRSFKLLANKLVKTGSNASTSCLIEDLSQKVSNKLSKKKVSVFLHFSPRMVTEPLTHAPSHYLSHWWREPELSQRAWDLTLVLKNPLFGSAPVFSAVSKEHPKYNRRKENQIHILPKRSRRAFLELSSTESCLQLEVTCYRIIAALFHEH